MKRLYSLLLAIITSLTAMAFEVDGIYYSVLSSSEMTVTVTSGETKYSGEVVIPEKVTYNGKEYSVTEIGYNAFKDCSGLTSVSIPSSVTSIGESAFYGCSGLISVTIPVSVIEIGDQAFYRCSAITVLNIEDGESILKLGSNGAKNGLFSYCPLESVHLGRTLEYSYSPFQDQTRLTTLTIGEKVTSIDKSAFSGCSGLTSITIPNSVTKLGDYAFYGCTSIKDLRIEDGESTLNVGNNGSETGLFSYCPLESVHLGRTLEYSYSPFRDQTKLTTLTIGDKVTSIGSEAFRGCSGLTSVVIPNSITSIEYRTFSGCLGLTSVAIPNSVTSIGESAFEGCSGLTSVTIPNSVTSIGSEAFYGCSGLTSVAIPNSVTSIGSEAFRGCSGLTSVAIPNSVTSIGWSAFSGCSGLTSVSISGSVTSIEYQTFYGCSSLTSVTIPNSVNSIGKSAFEDCSGLTSVSIPNSVTSIGNYAFDGCSGLTSVAIPNSVTSIGNYAFDGCSALITIKIEDGESTIKLDSDIFRGCPLETVHLGRTLDSQYSTSTFMDITKLTDLTIGDKVTSIGKRAFSGCSGLTSVTIPNSVTSIGLSAFESCSGLTSITIPNSVIEIGNNAFSRCEAITNLKIEDGESTLKLGYNNYASNTYYGLFKDCPLETVHLGRPLEYSYAPFRNQTKLTELTIGDKVTSIDPSAFEGCSGLTSVTISGSVTSIGSAAFSGCSGLTSVTIPNSVTSIGSAAFRGCSSLTSVTISGSVTSIDSHAFDGCSGLTSVTIPNSVTSIGSSAFHGCSGLTSVTISGSVTSIELQTFFGCSSLTSVTIPNSVTSIGSSAFYRCSGLISVTIPNSVTSIGSSAFYSCSGLTSATIPSSVTSIGSSAFEGCSGLTSATIPSSVTSIGSSAFEGCSGLTSVTIPNSITSIEYRTFYRCSSLTSVTIPNSVTSIGDQAFEGCTAIKELKIEDGESILKLGYNSYSKGLFSDNSIKTVHLGRTLEYSYSPFQNQTNLTTLTIGNQVTSIGSSAFVDCSALTTIISNAGTPPSIETNSFSSESYKNALVTVPVQSLESYKEQWNQFYYMKGSGTEKFVEYHVEPAGALVNMISPEEAESITSLKLTGTLNGTDLLTVNKLVNLEKLDISGCTIVSGGMPYYQTDNERFGTEDNTLGHFWIYNLDIISDVKLPETLTTIGANAFENKKRLTAITVPSSVVSIGENAFSGCTSLKDVVFMDVTEEVSLGDDVFNDCPIESLYLGRNLVYDADNNYYSRKSPFVNKSRLSDVTIGNLVTELGDCLFKGCSAIKTITLPSSLESIGYEAFYDCSSLIGVVMDDGETPLSVEREMFSRSKLITLYLGRDLKYDSDNSPFSYQSKLSDVTIGSKVTLIGQSAFKECTALESITIPASVNSIGNDAFKGCNSFENLTLEDGDSPLLIGTSQRYLAYEGYYDAGQFYYCPIKTLYLGRDLTYSVSPFQDRSDLSDITISNQVTAIGTNLFKSCKAITDIVIPTSVTSIGSGAFSSCTGITSINIPASVTSIGSGAFSSCTGITSITIPKGVTEIQSSVFSGCSALAEVSMLGDVTLIGASAFQGCTKLVAITLPLSVTEIGASAFKNCTALQAVTLSESIESLPESVFQNCSSLAAMTIPSSVTSIGASAFRGCSSIESMVIPSSVTKIEDYTFGKCTALTEISLPNTLRSIGNNAFNGCSALAAIAIPNPTESIGERAFDGCSGLKEITLPGSTRSIGQNAFSGCSQLANVYVINPIPPVIESNTFDAATQTAATLHVPEDSKAINWVHPYWGQFKKIENWTVGTTTEFVAENVSYHITSEADATVEISAVALGGSRAASEVKIPATVRFNDKVYTVAGVANNGFAGAQMTEVELPATVNYVGLAAFKGCQALTKVTVLNTLPPSADVSSFDEATYANAKLSVVEEAADAYREHSVWGLFGQTDAPAEEPTDPSDPSDPSDPTDPVDPSDPSDPSDPTDPVDPSDPSDPTDPSGIDGVGTEAVRPVVVPGGIDFEGVDGNTVVEIYSISGQRLYAGPARRKDLAAGYYIVRIGRHAFKIMVK